MTARRGFTLVEAVLAVLLLGLAVLTAASADAWTARLLAGAEEREDAAAAATAVLDSIVAAGVPAAGAVNRDGLRLVWTVQRADDVATIRLRATAPGRSQPLDEVFTAVWAPAPPSLDGP